MKTPTIKHFISLAILIILLLSACSNTNKNIPTPTAELDEAAVIMTAYAQITETARIAALSATPTNTPEPPTLTPTSTATNTPLPTATITNTPTPSFTPTQTSNPVNVITEDSIVIYFIHLGTGGPVACGDSLIPLATGHQRTGDTVKDLTTAMNALFSAGQYSGPFYNATYTSNLHVSGVEFNRGSGAVHVFMNGSYTKPKDACDASRYREQVKATVLQFNEVTNQTVWKGDKLLEDLLAVYSQGGS